MVVKQVEGNSDCIVHMHLALLGQIVRGVNKERWLRVVDFEVCNIELWDILLEKRIFR